MVKPDSIACKAVAVIPPDHPVITFVDDQGNKNRIDGSLVDPDQE